jgi:hypothetical protein
MGSTDHHRKNMRVSRRKEGFSSSSSSDVVRYMNICILVGKMILDEKKTMSLHSYFPNDRLL